MLHGWVPSIGHFLAGAVLTILCMAAAHDVLARTVPNWMPMTIATLGAAQSAIDGRLIASLLVGSMVFVLTGLCWKRGWLGGGDVKLLGAAAVAVPPMVVPAFIVTVALAGGVLSLAYLAIGKLMPAAFRWRPAGHPAGHPATQSIRRPTGLFSRAWRLERRRLSRGGPLPYAVAIAAGGLFIFL
jgi:prepilin peptidase CpaA